MRCYSKIFNLVSIKVNFIKTDWIAFIIETGLVKPATFESDDTSQKFACYIYNNKMRITILSKLGWWHSLHKQLNLFWDEIQSKLGVSLQKLKFQEGIMFLAPYVSSTLYILNPIKI
jgi:hypothetical protein